MNLEIRNVTMDYGRIRALGDVSLSIPPGIYGLLGKNGAGKTTLIRILATLLHQKKGSIHMDDLDWKNQSAVRMGLGYLPQHFAIYKYLTVRETLEHVASLKKLRRKGIRAEVDRVLELTNMRQQSKKTVRALSGGMQRRLGIAQAIIGSPKLLLFDEPTVGLDPQERLRFRQVLSQLSHQSIVLLSSHIVADLAHICDHIGVLHEGRALYDGTIPDLVKIGEGHVFVKDIHSGELAALQADERLTLIDITRFERDHVQVRFVAEESPIEGAASESPTLEDSYFYLLRGES